MTEILLYGEVGYDITAKGLKQDLDSAGGGDIVLRINSYGGSVFEGAAIISLLKEYKGKVTVKIDGVAASMASAIAMAGTHIAIAPNGYVMIHAPSTYTGGNSRLHEESLKLLKSIENNLKTIYAKRISDIVKLNALMDGNDHWFTAEQALEAGLVDEIITSPNATLDVIKLECRRVSARYVGEKTIENKKEMSITENKKEYPQDAKALMDLQARAEKAELELAQTKQKLEAIEQSAIKAMIDEAITSNKADKTQEATYYKIAKDSGIETLRSLLASLKPTFSVHAMLNTTEGTENKSSWSWDDWQAKNPKGLEKMEKENPEQFEALYKVKFNNK